MRAYIYCAHKASRNEQVSQHVATDSCQSCWMQDAGWLMIIPSLPSTNWRTCWTLHRCPKHQPSSFFFTWHFESVFSRIQICCQTRHQNCVAVSGVDAVRGCSGPTEKLHLEEDRCPAFSVRQVCLERGSRKSKTCNMLVRFGMPQWSTMREDGYLVMIPFN